MSYEFTKLSEVEVVETPTENANVLIEEDGVIKKAPKTAVGGASTGSVEPDMVITYTGSLGNSDVVSCLSVTHGSISNIFNKLQNNERPIVKICHVYGAPGENYHSINEFDAAVSTYGESYWFVAIIGSASGPSLWKLGFAMNSDNTFSWAGCASIAIE